jgi:plastocyanin
MTPRTFRPALTIVACIVLVGCASTAGHAGPPPSAPPGGAVVMAEGVAFDRPELAVPAGMVFPLLFENRDAAPHNVRIYDENGTQPLFVGEIFGGPASRTYQVPALPAGTHRFSCDVHPQMSGTVVAGSG